MLAMISFTRLSIPRPLFYLSVKQCKSMKTYTIGQVPSDIPTPSLGTPPTGDETSEFTLELEPPSSSLGFPR